MYCFDEFKIIDNLVVVPAKDPDSGKFERALSLESLAAAHDAGRAFMWARLRDVGGKEGVLELCEELDIDPNDIVYPPEMQQAKPTDQISPVSGEADTNSSKRGEVPAMTSEEASRDTSSIAEARGASTELGAGIASSAQSQVGNAGSWGWLESFKWPWSSGGQGTDTRGDKSSGSEDVSAEVERQENAERARYAASNDGTSAVWSPMHA